MGNVRELYIREHYVIRENLHGIIIPCTWKFSRRNFRELPAELNFCVFIFANGDLTIYIVYIANDLY